MTDNNYNPEAVRIARQYHAADDTIKNECNELILHPGNLPAEAMDGWAPMTLETFLEERPPVNYILDGILKETSLNIVYGAPGCMKSFLMQDLSICVAAGKSWLPVAPWQNGGQPIATKPGPVVWLDFDMGEDLIYERFRALIKHHQINDSLPIKVYSFPDPAFNAADMASVALLAARIEGASLVVIDNLGTVSGGVDENTSNMIQVMANLRWLAVYCNTCILVIHHQRKSGTSIGRAGDALRGHSSIEGSIDIGLHVNREPYAEEVTVKSTKTRTREVAPFTAYFTHENDTAGNLQTAAYYSVEPQDNESNYAIEREIKRALTEAAMNQTTLWQAVNAELPDIGKNRIIEKIRQMEGNGQLKVNPGMRNAKIYSIKDSELASLPEFTGASREGET